MTSRLPAEMFPAEGAWPPGVASAESILAVVEKGKKALLLIVGVVIGVGGKMIGILTRLPHFHPVIHFICLRTQ